MSIPLPVDVPGRRVSFRPSPSSHILEGEVVRVYFKYGEDARWPKGSKGYENGMRQLFKRISVLLPDGRILNMSCEQEDLRQKELVAISDG
jgi:hypothetical protein